MDVDDRTILHMLRAVQYVQIKRELRRLSFRALDVEQIGYVYEGLLSYEGKRATDTVVGLIGKAGLEEEVPLAELEAHAAAAPVPEGLAARLADGYKDSGIGTAKALTRKLAPPGGAERAEALRQLLAVAGGDLALAQRRAEGGSAIVDLLFFPTGGGKPRRTWGSPRTRSPYGGGSGWSVPALMPATVATAWRC